MKHRGKIGGKTAESIQDTENIVRWPNIFVLGAPGKREWAKYHLKIQ